MRAPPVAGGGRRVSGSGQQMRKALVADEDAGHRNRKAFDDCFRTRKRPPLCSCCGTRNSLFAVRSRNFDHCHSLSSLYPPLAALASLPPSGRCASM